MPNEGIVDFSHDGKQGHGYVEVPPPDVLSFSSPKNDAALTFINRTTLNGVLFGHGRVFDVVASENLLQVLMAEILPHLHVHYLQQQRKLPLYVLIQPAVISLLKNLGHCHEFSN